LVSIFCFLKEKAKGFPLLSGLGDGFSKENKAKKQNLAPSRLCETSKIGQFGKMELWGKRFDREKPFKPENSLTCKRGVIRVLR